MKNLPNYLTLLRVLLIPILVGIFVVCYDPSNEKPVFAAFFGIFILASITDFFDGYLARKLKVESNFGAMMDQIADKLMVGTLLIILTYLQKADIIPVIVIILRELLVSGFREFIAGNKGAMPVTKLAKWKTTFQMIAITMLLFVPLAESNYVQEVEAVARILLWFAALLTFITGWQYTTHTMRFLRGLK